MIFSLFPAYPRSDIYRCVSGLSRIFIDPRSLCSLCLPTRLDRKADMDRSGTLETRKRTLLACRLHPSRMKSALVSRISRLKNPLRASITTAFIPSIPLSFVSLRHIFSQTRFIQRRYPVAPHGTEKDPLAKFRLLKSFQHSDAEKYIYIYLLFARIA